MYFAYIHWIKMAYDATRLGYGKKNVMAIQALYSSKFIYYIFMYILKHINSLVENSPGLKRKMLQFEQNAKENASAASEMRE